MNKRARINTDDKAFVNVWQREVGQLSTRNFAHRIAASEDLVLRLDIHRKLDKHRGCVNTVSFNADGDIIVSGSDDRRVILWDWQTGRTKLSFHSGHHNNVFQAKIMSYSNDRSIVTCAADGQVRHAQILDGGGVETVLLAKHHGRAHKLAVEPGSPHIFYTCGEDGLVQHIDLRTGSAIELFTCYPISEKRSFMPMAVVNLNAITIDPRNPNLFAVAGADPYARLYDIRMYKWDGSSDFGHPTNCFCPEDLVGDELVGITGLAFSDQSELLVSYNDEFIYLFTRDMGLGPRPKLGSVSSSPTIEADKRSTPQVYKGHKNCETVKGVSFFGPRCEYVVSGSDCGRIFIWRKKGGELVRVMEADKHVVNCIEPHPHTTVLASSGIEHDIKIWTPKAIERAVLPENIEQVLVPGHSFWFATSGDEDSSSFLYDDDTDDSDDEEDDSDDSNDSNCGNDYDDGGENDDNSGCSGDDDNDDNSGGGDGGGDLSEEHNGCNEDVDFFLADYDDDDDGDANDSDSLQFLCSAETKS